MNAYNIAKGTCNVYKDNSFHFVGLWHPRNRVNPIPINKKKNIGLNRSIFAQNTRPVFVRIKWHGTPPPIWVKALNES